jgi:hypothetical protein
MSAFIQVSALGDLKRYFEDLPDIAEQAAALAINETASREGLTLIRKDMRDQVNFPSGYLEGDRLRVTRKASRGALEAVIRGRDRATSLARFAKGQTPANTKGRGVRVQVKNGRVQVLRKAFLMPLRNGNTGLAVRLKAGESMKNSGASVAIGKNLYLLYGPSVDQVFRGVADDRSADIMDMVSRKFLRQFARLSNG